MSNYERNICAELGCPSACCHGPIQAVAKDMDDLRTFAGGEPILFIESSEFAPTQDFPQPIGKAILAEDGLDDGSGIPIIVPHDCQYLDGNSCGNIPKRLKACGATPAGGAYCTISRKKFGLPPVTDSMIDALG
jgi:hypothetical protein